MDHWIAFDPLYTLSLPLFWSLYKWKFSNTQHHLEVNTTSKNERAPDAPLKRHVLQKFVGVRREHEETLEVRRSNDSLLNEVKECCFPEKEPEEANVALYSVEVQG